MRLTFKRNLVRGVILAGAAGSAAVFGTPIGCSSGRSTSDKGSDVPATWGPSNHGEQTGAVGMQLTLPGGEQINVVNWTITGPNNAATVVQSGSVNVQNSQSISFLVGGIPPGTNYNVTLSATSTDGMVTCSGSAQFSTSARTTTNVAVQLQCSGPVSEAGSVQVNGITYNCAAWGSVSANPSEVIVGNSIALSATATGPNPAALTYAWSAPSGSGTFDTPNAATANFTCGAAGQVALALTVADGPVPDGGTCNPSLATTTVQVQCDGHLDQAAQFATATKIKHVVVIFGENVSFDHYFGTYPSAQNNAGETPFSPLPGTPKPNNLGNPLDPTMGFAPIGGINLLTMNPNASNTANGTGATNPFRLAAAQAATQSQGHNYKPEQQADDNGAMDLFPEFTGNAGPPPSTPPIASTKGQVMAYFDGNTVSEIWSLAQNYAMNDNSWTTTFGPSTPGALNLISGQTNGLATMNKAASLFAATHIVADGVGNYTIIGDTDPQFDMCSLASDQNTMLGQNIGNLLNAQGISWGFFEGGFDLTITNANATTGCARKTTATVPGIASTSVDYIPHHQPFQYYPSTANITHARPSAVAAIGKTLEGDGVTVDPANHQYDSHDFFDALAAGNLPAVVYLKAPAYQDGHPGYSDPVDEQNFVTSVVNALQGAQEWSTTALILAYDDSDGWYDHQMPPIVNPSTSLADALNVAPSDAGAAGTCSSGAQQTGAAPTTPLLGAVPAEGGSAQPVQGRCGYGTRIPLLVVSPFAKRNYVDHTLTDQTSILKFIEDNWLGGQRIQPGGSFDAIAGTIQNMLNP
jgi:phospholipase C